MEKIRARSQGPNIETWTVSLPFSLLYTFTASATVLAKEGKAIRTENRAHRDRTNTEQFPASDRAAKLDKSLRKGKRRGAGAEQIYFKDPFLYNHNVLLQVS